MYGEPLACVECRHISGNESQPSSCKTERLSAIARCLNKDDKPFFANVRGELSREK
jgi:hypothetical protein